MSVTRDNHYVPQWYQKGFMDERRNELRHIKKKSIPFPGGTVKTVDSKKWYTSAQMFYQTDLYTTFFADEINDEIEKKLFGYIDGNGSEAVKAFLTDDEGKWHENFEDFFVYLDAQKLRTPKGLDWIQSKYPSLHKNELLREMQALRTIHCTLWAEGVRELVSAEDSKVKFIVSDHPVTVYNYACPPKSEQCVYPHDPDIALKGTQTIFPLDKNRCLILTNLEYAQNPNDVDPLELRTNAVKNRSSLVMTINFINSRKLTDDEVIKINHIIKSRRKDSVAAGTEEWLYPEKNINCEWHELRDVLLPPENKLFHFGGEMFASFEGGAVHYQDAYGRTTKHNDFLDKNIDESKIGRNDYCGCGSGKKYKKCCMNVPEAQRTTWKVASIRERNLALCNAIKDILGFNTGKTWVDVRREITEDNISKIYSFFEELWPTDTDIYALLPKSDEKFRAIYSGILDMRTISSCALKMSSYFDELLIENPMIHPNFVRPEFSPTKSPSQYKYQAIKDFMFILGLEPFIANGLVNLIPDPVNFDLSLSREMMRMAKQRGSEFLSDADRKLHFSLSREDLINTVHTLAHSDKVKTLVSQLGIVEQLAEKLINEMEGNPEAFPLMLLQPDVGEQFMFFKMSPNYEMGLFIAQTTGSVIVTDSESRWNEFQSAQNRPDGFVSYPWAPIHSNLKKIPLDSEVVQTFHKSSKREFVRLRQFLKSLDELIVSNVNSAEELTRLTHSAEELIKEIESNSGLVMANLNILSPEGGFHDNNVQRLLLKSSCQNYLGSVRSLYFLS